MKSMKFIPSPGSWSGQNIYTLNGVSVTQLRGLRYRYLVSIFDLDFFVQTDKEVPARDLLNFVIKKNPNSGEWLLKQITYKAKETGKEEGREEMRRATRELLGFN